MRAYKEISAVLNLCRDDEGCTEDQKLFELLVFVAIKYRDSLITEGHAPDIAAANKLAISGLVENMEIAQ